MQCSRPTNLKKKISLDFFVCSSHKNFINYKNFSSSLLFFLSLSVIIIYFVSYEVYMWRLLSIWNDFFHHSISLRFDLKLYFISFTRWKNVCQFFFLHTNCCSVLAIITEKNHHQYETKCLIFSRKKKWST